MTPEIPVPRQPSPPDRPEAELHPDLGVARHVRWWRRRVGWGAAKSLVDEATITTSCSAVTTRPVRPRCGPGGSLMCW